MFEIELKIIYDMKNKNDNGVNNKAEYKLLDDVN